MSWKGKKNLKSKDKLKLIANISVGIGIKNIYPDFIVLSLL